MEQVDIILFSQNLILHSLEEIFERIEGNIPIVLLTTHMLLDNERRYIETLTSRQLIYRDFAQELSDNEMADIDVDSYKKESNNLGQYYIIIKKEKNILIHNKICAEFRLRNKVIASDNLGIDSDIWVFNGFNRYYASYYFEEQTEDCQDKKQSMKMRLAIWLECKKSIIHRKVYVSREGKKKYVFLGKMYKVEQQLSLRFRESKWELFIFIIKNSVYNVFPFFGKKDTYYLSSLHEVTGWNINNKFPLYLIQDGYLPPNYTGQYLKFYGKNVTYYAWDEMGQRIFNNQNISNTILPFRNKLYLPNVKFSPNIKKILIATSGAGDWTALKNRADEDRMIVVISNLAKRYPKIEFIYRCHPAWVHPEHQGVYSIKRTQEYFDYLGAKNIKISGNIPDEHLDDFQLTIPKTSLTKDLEDVDLMIGEHSMAMIDAGMLHIPFVSCNFTGRRDFFVGMTEMGFPHCETEEELNQYIMEYGMKEHVKKYDEAICRYNKMIDIQ